MSKLQVAIIDALGKKEWMTPPEIAESTRYGLKSVRVTLSKMETRGLIAKKDNPEINFGKLFKKVNMPAGFGVSQKLYNFQIAVAPVRLKYEATN